MSCETLTIGASRYAAAGSHPNAQIKSVQTETRGTDRGCFPP